MKSTILLFCLVVFTGFGQTINRQLYERYFKQLYTYEPAMVRENNIDSLEVFYSKKWGDETWLQGKKESISFREDGRPIQRITWEIYDRDSVMEHYRYDSLGNLVEYRQWIPKGINEREDKVLRNQFYQYRDNLLINVFCYSMINGNNYLTLRFCDSLSYSADFQKITITHGGADGSEVIFNKIPQFSYPVKARNNTVFIATEKARPDKPVDKEIFWSAPCNYSVPELKEIQSRMKTPCLNPLVVQSFYMLQSKKDLKVTYDRAVLGLSVNAFFIDTLEQRLFVKNSRYSRQPTSLEDRETRTISTDRYNFQMQLLISESIEERSRGKREYSVDSSQTIYTYFNFGLLQRKLEYIYSGEKHREVVPAYGLIKSGEFVFKNEPAAIFEEKVVIKQRD